MGATITRQLLYNIPTSSRIICTTGHPIISYVEKSNNSHLVFLMCSFKYDTVEEQRTVKFFLCHRGCLSSCWDWALWQKKHSATFVWLFSTVHWMHQKILADCQSQFVTETTFTSNIQTYIIAIFQISQIWFCLRNWIYDASNCIEISGKFEIFPY